MYIVFHYHSHRYWIEGAGWSTSASSRATRYTEYEARKWASRVYGEAVPV